MQLIRRGRHSLTRQRLWILVNSSKLALFTDMRRVTARRPVNFPQPSRRDRAVTSRGLSFAVRRRRVRTCSSSLVHVAVAIPGRLGAYSMAHGCCKYDFPTTTHWHRLGHHTTADSHWLKASKPVRLPSMPRMGCNAPASRTSTGGQQIQVVALAPVVAQAIALRQATKIHQ
jgi:hypothetical protein